MDELEAKVREALWRKHSRIERCYGPNPCMSEIVDYLTPDIARALRAAVDRAFDDGISHGWSDKNNDQIDTTHALAAGLAELERDDAEA